MLAVREGRGARERERRRADGRELIKTRHVTCEQDGEQGWQLEDGARGVMRACLPAADSRLHRSTTKHLTSTSPTPTPSLTRQPAHYAESIFDAHLQILSLLSRDILVYHHQPRLSVLEKGTAV